MSTGALPPARAEKGFVQVSRRRRALAAIAMAATVLLARLRSATRRSGGRLRREARAVAPGELIVVYPAEAGADGSRADPIVAMLGTVERAMRRWEVTVSDVAGGKKHSVDRRRLTGRSRAYVRLSTANGAEDDALRAIGVAAWKYGIPRGRRGVLAVRSPVIVPAAPAGPPGEIEFTPAYTEAKRRIGVDRGDAAGVRVLIVDVDRPDKQYLPNADVEVLDPSERSIANGHATLVAAIVADIARGVKITTRSIRDEHSSAGFWALLDILTTEQDADLIVASVSAPEGGNSKDGRGRDNVFDCLLRSRVSFANQPPVLFPTGNHDARRRRARIDTIAIPARFESVVAIGACDESGDRSAGSRYGLKTGEDPHAWWLAPGGSFEGQRTTTPLVLMDGRPQAGTSIANAIAGALVACSIKDLRERQPATDEEFDAALALVMNRLQERPGSQRSLALASGLADVHGGRALTLTKLTAELETLSYRDGIRGYDERQHGRGMLRLDPRG